VPNPCRARRTCWEFPSALQPKVLGQLVEAVFEKMKLAGESGKPAQDRGGDSRGGKQDEIQIHSVEETPRQS